jgi:hypothetical protein
MNQELDPLDPTGLTFDGHGSRYGHRTRQFTVTGFRDRDHAVAWSEAYYKRAMGYGPSMRIQDTEDGYIIDVNEMTSCD